MRGSGVARVYERAVREPRLEHSGRRVAPFLGDGQPSENQLGAPTVSCPGAEDAALCGGPVVLVLFSAPEEVELHSPSAAAPRMTWTRRALPAPPRLVVDGSSHLVPAAPASHVEGHLGRHDVTVGYQLVDADGASRRSCLRSLGEGRETTCEPGTVAPELHVQGTEVTSARF